VSYRIELIPPACDEIQALPGSVREQALELVAALADEPRPARARQLESRPEIHRIWLAGKWRVAYEVDDEARRLLILCLRREGEIDFDTLPSWMHESGADFQPVSGISPKGTSGSC
jgi:mRNA-degrading endonuclease RelE of RelBE toxin-antitoxin system